MRSAWTMLLTWGLLGCAASSTGQPVTAQGASPSATGSRDEPRAEDFEYVAEQVADLRILRYRVEGFDELTLPQKELVYDLYQAALAGRDVFWDQNYRYNLAVRHVLDALVQGVPEDQRGTQWPALVEYAKRVWFSNGIHHHYSTDKLIPGFTEAAFDGWMHAVDPATLPRGDGRTVDELVASLRPILFDPAVDAKRVNLDPSRDLAAGSANNYYGSDVTQAEVESFYADKIDPADPRPVSWGLNSRLVHGPDGLTEEVWKVGGRYDGAITQIVRWLRAAVEVAENEAQRRALELLVQFYETGELATFDAYSIAWVEDADSRIDVVNGFIEVYGDPMGYRGAFESIVSIRDLEASKRIATISSAAQWFEDHSPIAEAFKKPQVQGISAKVIEVIVESGDAAPATPIGINLPNANWIRVHHGSKSVHLGNIVHAYDMAKKTSGTLVEFAASAQEVERARTWGPLADTLHTDLHEVIGHASGRLGEGVGTPKETLKSYASTLEEARADLVALYFLLDPKLVDLGVMPDLDVGKAAYDHYLRNGLLVQLARVELGQNLEEAHMRCRRMITAWVMEAAAEGGAVSMVRRDDETYVQVHDYEALRRLFGVLLTEVQRIESEGDYTAGRDLVESYGVQVDPALHAEVRRRYDALGIAPYGGFIQPRLRAVREADELVDVVIEYPPDFLGQMLEYDREYGFLPVTLPPRVP